MRITHPHPTAGRQKFLGVEFVDGVATLESLHPVRELALRQHGAVIEPDPEVEAPFQESLGEPIIDLNDLTIPQLRELAGDRVEIPPRAKKSDVVAIVATLPAEPIPGSVPHPNGGFIHPGALAVFGGTPTSLGETFIPAVTDRSYAGALESLNESEQPGSEE